MIYFLIKFFKKKQHAEDFVRGKIFANRLSEFKRIESGDNFGRIDRHEGTVAWYQPENIRLTLNDIEIPSSDLAAPVSIQMGWLNHINVYCMHAAHTGDLKSVSLSREGIEAFRQKLLVPDKCLDLGEYAVVVYNVPAFVKRMDAFAKARNYMYWHQLVKYYSPETFDGSFSDGEALFRKQATYSFQREYRFAIWDGVDGVAPIILEIGDLSNITMQLKASELNGEKLFGGHLELSERTHQSR